MATGENFKRICWMKKKEPKKVDKKAEQTIKTEVEKLQNERTLLYENDDISDDELNIKCAEIEKRIHDLINAIYI